MQSGMPNDDQKGHSSFITIIICATDKQLVEDASTKLKSFVCKQIPLQGKQLTCFTTQGRPAWMVENSVVLTDVPPVNKSELAAVLTKVLHVQISEAMLHFKNHKVTVSQLAPQARQNLLSKKAIFLGDGKKALVQQPKAKQEIKSINSRGLEKRYGTCIWVNRNDLTLDIYGFNSRSVESTLVALARLITPATSTLEVDIFQATFLLQHKAQLDALKNLHGNFFCIHALPDIAQSYL